MLEDIAGATDEQVGAGVRRLHQAWQKVIKEHLTLEPIMAAQEDETVTVPVGFDPSAIRVTGNVTGNPPFRGVVRAPGLARQGVQAARAAGGDRRAGRRAGGGGVAVRACSRDAGR